jgi:hypothetical protein
MGTRLARNPHTTMSAMMERMDSGGSQSGDSLLSKADSLHYADGVHV